MTGAEEVGSVVAVSDDAGSVVAGAEEVASVLTGFDDAGSLVAGTKEVVSVVSIVDDVASSVIVASAASSKSAEAEAGRYQ